MKLNKKFFNEKKKIFSVAAICLAVLLVLASFLGLGFSIYGIYENYKLSPDYTRSLNVKTRLDSKITGFNDSRLTEEDVKDTAESFSNFLKNNGKIDYDVWYEYYQSKKPDASDDAFLTINVPVQMRKTMDIDDDEEKEVEIAPQVQYFDSLDSNDRTIVYRWYAEPTTSDLETPAYQKPVYTVIPLDLMFNWKKSKVELNTEKNSYGIALSINDAVTNLFPSPITLAEEIHRDMAAYTKLEDKKDKQAPELFIINDLNNLINKANFYINVKRIVDDGHFTEANQYFDDIYKPYIKGTSIEEFINDFQNLHGKNDYAYLTDAEIQDPQIKAIYNHFTEIFNFLDPTGEDGNATGNVKYEWMSKNIDKIITSNNINDFIPQKINEKITNPKELEINHKIDWMFWEFGSEVASKDFYRIIDNYSFTAPISLLPIYNLGKSDAKIDPFIVFKFYKQELTYTYNQPSFFEAIFGSDNIAFWSLIGLIIFLLVIGAGLIYWYRFTGFFSWLMILVSASVSFVVLVATAHLISTALIVGLFLTVLVGIITAIIICEKIKRKIVEGNDTNIVINQGFFKSLLPSFDLSFILMLIGICLVYFSTAAIVPMGIMLISGAVFNWIFIFLGNWLLNFCFFVNKLLFNRKKFIAKFNPDISVVEVYNISLSNKAYSETQARIELEKTQLPKMDEQTKIFGKAPSFKQFTKWVKYYWAWTITLCKKMIPVTMDCPTNIPTAGRFTNSFYSSSFKNLNIFKSKFQIITLVISLLFIIGFFCFIFLGINNVMVSTDSFRIVVDKAGYDQIVNMSLGLKYSVNSYDGLYYLYFNQALSGSIQISILTAVPTAQMQTVFGYSQVDILLSCIKAISIAGAFIIIYLTVRNNWTVFVPLLLSIVITPIIALGFISILGVWFDQTIIYGLIIVFTTNALLSSMMCNNINNKWKRKEIYTPLEMRYLINSELKNSSKLWILIASTLILFFIVFIITMPVALFGSSIVILIGSILSLVVPFYILPRTLYWFLCARIKYVNSTIMNNDKRLAKNSFDKVDEQLIDGINKNSPIRIFI